MEIDFALRVFEAFKCCSASGSGYSMSYSVKWDLPDQRPSDAPEPLYLNGGVNLFIESVQLTDSGEYRCTVYDDTIDRNYDDHGFQVSVYGKRI